MNEQIKNELPYVCEVAGSGKFARKAFATTSEAYIWGTLLAKILESGSYIIRRGKAAVVCTLSR